MFRYERNGKSAFVSLSLIILAALLTACGGKKRESAPVSTNPDAPSYAADVFYEGWYKDNPKYECFVTPYYGEDVIASFYEENGAIMLALGDETPFQITWHDSFEGYNGFPPDDPESHVIIQAVSQSEIEISSSGRYGRYHGVYARLPD